MALIDQEPVDLPSSNELDKFEDDLLSVPPAYLVLGTTPAAMVDPPAYGDTITCHVRLRCTAEHGPIERKDGERRYTRSMAIQAIWKDGEPEPPDADAEQPGLFDEGDPSDEATGE
jgi:hypothetical protein